MNDTIINAAKRYAKTNKCDIIRPTGEQDGFSYFRIDFTGRPKYAGLPVIIKINQFGKVFRVSSFNEIFWASNQVKDKI